MPFEPVVAKPAIGVQSAAGPDRLNHERLQAVSRRIRYAAHPDPADGPLAALLSGNDNQSFFKSLPATYSLFKSSKVALVDLNFSEQWFPSRCDHRPTKLVKVRPRCLVAAESEHALQPQSTGTVLLADHPPNCAEPHGKGRSSTVKDRSCCYRCLATTRRTLPQFACRPSLGTLTPGTYKAVMPPNAREIPSAGFRAGEAPLQIGQILRIVFHGG